MWAPDVYEGSPTSVTLFFTMVPKIAALTVFIRFLYVPFLNLIDQWQMILIFLSIASMLFGAVAAIGQTNLKRLVAYSSIGHVGYALAGVAAGTNDGIQSSVIYITIYVIMNLGLFSCLLMLKRNNQYYENLFDNFLPGFINPIQNDLRINQNSEAIGLGSSEFAIQTPYDILNIDRTSNSDLGAYQHVIIED